MNNEKQKETVTKQPVVNVVQLVVFLIHLLQKKICTVALSLQLLTITYSTPTPFEHGVIEALTQRGFLFSVDWSRYGQRFEQGKH